MLRHSAQIAELELLLSCSHHPMQSIAFGRALQISFVSIDAYAKAIGRTVNAATDVQAAVYVSGLAGYLADWGLCYSAMPCQELCMLGAPLDLHACLSSELHPTHGTMPAQQVVFTVTITA